DDITEIDEPRSNDDLGAFEPVGPLSVPTFVAVAKCIAHVLSETEPLSELVGGQIMVLGERLERPTPVTQETQRDPGSLEQRPTGAADVLKHEGGGRHGAPKVISIVAVALDRQFIAEPLGLLICIGVAAHPRQQSGVVQDRALRLVQTQMLGQAQGYETGPHHVLHRLTQTEVGTERQESDQFGKAQVAAVPRCHTPTVAPIPLDREMAGAALVEVGHDGVGAGVEAVGGYDATALPVAPSTTSAAAS